ncbi:phage tail assembly chaperone [Vallitalea guaymasensis]|uniref:phage tail assembly chaperone n=1 Tax=Vallitalea guaymasensis TaxID=1185412 RepID=UPI000DE3DEBA|nr:hypothetical protein [Vallitalea guaymasensis]
MENKSILDILLETDINKISELSKTTVEINRLSKVLGEKLILDIRALTSQELEIIEGDNIYEKYIIKAVTIEGKKLTDPILLNKFNIKDPLKIVNKLFNAGEIFNLYKKISSLSGFDEESVKEIKN